MEMDLVPSDALEEEILEIDDNYDNADFSGETCGICTDIIIDRGVLDCCQHWFCFGCIDNWSTIINLCPLCQSEFQMITCVPVYDTIGSSNNDEDSFPRDEDWCIDGNSNSLPSHYVDENAVICLNGDACKIRTGSALDEDRDLDTSIACDSCDTWYHAVCVGFDTEDTSEDTWICPKCADDEVGEIADLSPKENPNASEALENAHCNYVAEATLCKQVLVDGEVAENQVTEEPKTSDPIMEKKTYHQHATENTHSECFNEATFSGKVSISLADEGDTALVVSMVVGNQYTEEPHELQSNSVVHTGFEVKSNGYMQPTLESQELEMSVSHDKSSSIASNSFEIDKLKVASDRGTMNEKSSSIGIEPSSVWSFNELCDQDELYERESSMGLHLADKLTPDANMDHARSCGAKRKNAEECRSVDDKESQVKLDTDIRVKKVRFEGLDQAIPVNGSVTYDIMSIVQSNKQKSSKNSEQHNPSDESSKERENVAGVRVKKIMRKADQDTESTVVTKLRRDIREAVVNKSAKDIGENLFNPKLLAAFRAAIAAPTTEFVGKLSPLAIKAKKSILEKGKVRENLTKKIYGNSNGRRKRAWDRDCEVEFWKHRSIRGTKPEKIETLKSVLNLLQKNPEDLKVEPVFEGQTKNPILSRLYIADTSVFPRKDDIKPLSASNEEQIILIHKVSTPLLESNIIKSAVTNKVLPNVKVSSPDNMETKAIAQLSKANTVSNKGNLTKRPDCSSSGTQKKLVKTNVKPDTRKLALDVLARMKAGASKNVLSEKREDSIMQKGSYPLLAQLPIDMRPVLAASSSNKIPISVRQSQLYRLAESFLRQENLSEIRRTAETELAIADAVNIEKEVAAKSNSKIVYLNLCSQEILHHSNDNKSAIKPKEPDSLLKQPEETPNELPTDPDVTDALRTAGLLSDSPPGSPCQQIAAPCLLNQPDSHSEMDLNGDLEHGFANEDHIGGTATKVEENDPKGTVVLSTSTKVRNNVSDSEVCHMSGNVEPNDYSCSPKSQNGASTSVEMGISCLTLTESLPKDQSRHQAEESDVLDTEPTLNKLTQKRESSAENKVPCDDKSFHLNQSVKASSSENDSSGEKAVDISNGGNVLHNSDLSENVHEKKEVIPNANSIQQNDGQLNKSVKAPVSKSDSLNEKVVAKPNSSENVAKKEKIPTADNNQQTDAMNSIRKKVEAYVKEHIRPLCKIGVITTEQYRWVVVKTSDKIMKYHSKAKNANFLIKEGEKVKRLAEQYVEASQKEKSDP